MPCFCSVLFIASYFFFAIGLKKANDKWGYFVKYEKKLIKLYIIWTLISLPLSAYTYYQMYGANIPKYIFVLIRKIFFVGSFGVFWYLLALILSIVLIYFFTVKIKQVKLMYILAVLFYIYAIIYNGFQPLFSQIPLFQLSFKATHFIFSWTNNFLMTGLIYVSAGYFLAHHKIKINLLWSWVGFIVAVLLKYSETFFYLIEKAITGMWFCLQKINLQASKSLRLFSFS